MPGTKRSSDSAAGPTTRSSKVAKTDPESGDSTPKSKPASKKGRKRGAKPAIPASSFKSKALPLHINLTHTPPSIPKDDNDAGTPTDVGFIGNLTLVPSSFQTGSYGWKGSKRVTVELQDSEGGEGEKEKVQVMLTINATVIGSKQATEEDEAEETKDSGDVEEEKEEVADEGVVAE